MSNFDTAILTVLKNEGGYVDNPSDPGGATNFGISYRFLSSLEKNKTVTYSDIRALTQDQAIAIYKSQWWDRYQYGRINDQSIATKLLDLSVNMGAANAHTSIQRAIRSVNGVRLNEDGILGDESIKEINAVNSIELLCALKSEAAGRYREFKNPHFLEGWLNRCYS